MKRSATVSFTWARVVAAGRFTGAGSNVVTVCACVRVLVWSYRTMGCDLLLTGGQRNPKKPRIASTTTMAPTMYMIWFMNGLLGMSGRARVINQCNELAWFT
jgi:hypothetical protein